MSTDPIFVRIGATHYYYQNDHLGTPQKITRKNGEVVWSAVYDSFGNCQVETEAIVNNLRLPGQYFDEETGLYYNWNRYYDPTIGRYLRTDPYGDGLNLYAYCFNNPISFMDPWGLCAVKDFGTLQGQANFWAGFGDALTFGGTRWIRDQWDEAAGLTDTVNYDSFLYGTGGFASEALAFTLGGAAVAKFGGRLASLTTSDGFLLKGFNVKAPFNIPVQRFGNMSLNRPDYWGPRIGKSKLANRAFAAIKPKWNPLNQYTKGVIPKGTPMKVGIVGPQGLKYPGGSLQFVVNSRSVTNQTSRFISR